LKTEQQVMTGNQALARGFFEAGVELAAACQGTYPSEFLSAVIELGRAEGRAAYTEESTNEKCAFEVAFGAASIGGKAACFLNHTGLNAAFASLSKALEKPIDGGLVVVSCDDPDPESCRTEEDARLLASLYGITVFDPASAGEAADVAYYALNHSCKQKKPVIIRITRGVSHAGEAVSLYPPGERTVVLNEGIQPAPSNLQSDTTGLSPDPRPPTPVTSASASSNLEPRTLNLEPASLAVVASGMSYSLVYDVIHDLGIEQSVPIYKVLTVYPPDKKLINFVKTMRKVLVFEETDQVIEMLLGDRARVLGRANGCVPGTGEITHDVARSVIARTATEMGIDCG
jgi:indolepyruvate ferredoxin oxidoreductase, alpha subunit